jgi:hypothetical protein
VVTWLGWGKEAWGRVIAIAVVWVVVERSLLEVWQGICGVAIIRVKN